MPPRATRPATLFPYSTPFRSDRGKPLALRVAAVAGRRVRLRDERQLRDRLVQVLRATVVELLGAEGDDRCRRIDRVAADPGPGDDDLAERGGARVPHLATDHDDPGGIGFRGQDRKSTRLNSSH